jgi:hypothetical protein
MASAEGQDHRLSRLVDVNGVEEHLAVAGTTEQADAVAEDDRQNEHDDLVDQVGLEALLGDLGSEHKEILPGRGAQPRGNGLSDVT